MGACCIHLRFSQILFQLSAQQTWPDSISDYVIKAFAEVGMKCPADILPFNDLEMSKLSGISRTTCIEVHKTVVNMFRVKSVTATDLLASCPLLSTGITALDAVLDGGIRMGWLSEISGQAGCGKTQFCMTLAAHALVKGFSVFWIDTENSFRPKRLMEILGGHALAFDNISIASCSTLDEMMVSLNSVSIHCETSSIKSLIIVDSVAAVLRNSGSRAKDLDDVMNILRPLKGIVVCTNHVVSDMNVQSEPNAYKPALGTKWGNSFHCRFLIERKTISPEERKLMIIKSPTCGLTGVPVRISSTGVAYWRLSVVVTVCFAWENVSKKRVPNGGLEPPTTRLRAVRSTD